MTNPTTHLPVQEPAGAVEAKIDEIRDLVSSLGDYRPASFDVPAWQREPDGSINHDKSKGTAAVRVWRAMRDSYLARNPGACSVTDGEAKK